LLTPNEAAVAANSADVRRSWPARVRIVEVGPRDGLQNEETVVATADKIRFVDELGRSGLRDIEVSSFVSPARVPQLADADAVFSGLARQPGVRYSGLVANERGLDRALAARVDGIALFTAASDTFARHNIGMDVEQSLAVFRGLAESAKASGLWVRAYVSTAFTCPYEGPIAPSAVVHAAGRLLEMGADEISIGDTIGSAGPEDVARLTEALLRVVPVERFAYHFHDTRGTALLNVSAALPFGIAIFDSSAGGLGGCPFAPGAPGNLATEDLLRLLESHGIETGVDAALVRSATRHIRSALKRAMNTSG
jgi:hydroxymethylglutaryl-CoA lyase